MVDQTNKSPIKVSAKTSLSIKRNLNFVDLTLVMFRQADLSATYLEFAIDYVAYIKSGSTHPARGYYQHGKITEKILSIKLTGLFGKIESSN